MKMIKKLTVFVLFITIIGIIMYTCSSPIAVQGITEAGITSGTSFVSDALIAPASGNKSFLVVSGISSTSITIAIKSAADAAAATNGTDIGSETISSSGGTDMISGIYPIVNFQNGNYSGTITFIDNTQLKITFQQHNTPYFQMRDVVCKTR